MKKLQKLCKDALKIPPEEIAQMRQIAQDQSAYIHPLKMATQGRQNSLGSYNMMVLDAVENLIKILNTPPDHIKGAT